MPLLFLLSIGATMVNRVDWSTLYREFISRGIQEDIVQQGILQTLQWIQTNQQLPKDIRGFLSTVCWNQKLAVYRSRLSRERLEQSWSQEYSPRPASAPDVYSYAREVYSRAPEILTDLILESDVSSNKQRLEEILAPYQRCKISRARTKLKSDLV